MNRKYLTTLCMLFVCAQFGVAADRSNLAHKRPGVRKKAQTNTIKTYQPISAKMQNLDSINPIPPQLNPLVVPNALGIAETATASNPLILQIHTPFQNSPAFVSELEYTLYEARNTLKDYTISGILLICDTGYSRFTDSNKVADLINNFKTKLNLPVYTYIDGNCHDLAILMAVSGSKIYASSSSSIGDIGLGPNTYFNYTNAPKIEAETSGVLSTTNDPPIKVISSGEGRDAGYPWVEWPDGSFDWLEQLSQAKYTLALERVAAARPGVSVQDLEELGAKIILAEEAFLVGLVDEVGASREDALTALATEAGVIEQDYRVIEFFLEPQTQGFTGTRRQQYAWDGIHGPQQARERPDPLAPFKNPQVIY